MTKTLLLLTILAGVLHLESASDSTDQVQTIKATVVAYDLGVEQADGSCKQTAIARSDKSAKRNESDRYFIIRHQSSCPKLIPEESLKVDRKRSLKLKRDTKCDQTLEDLKYFITLFPTGLKTQQSFMHKRSCACNNSKQMVPGLSIDSPRHSVLSSALAQSLSDLNCK